MYRLFFRFITLTICIRSFGFLVCSIFFGFAVCGSLIFPLRPLFIIIFINSRAFAFLTFSHRLISAILASIRTSTTSTIKCFRILTVPFTVASSPSLLSLRAVRRYMPNELIRSISGVRNLPSDIPCPCARSRHIQTSERLSSW